MVFPVLNNEFFEKSLEEIDSKIKNSSPNDRITLFEKISISIFGLLSIQPNKKYPNLSDFFPIMPPEKIQKNWVGKSGVPLLKQTIYFVSLINKFSRKYLEIPIKKAKVLDYGCGWGRILRLLYKYIPTTNLYGIDPNKKIIDLSKKTGVKGNIALCDYVPEKIPFNDQNFDIIYAFSVFTHLSEKTHQRVLSIIHKRLKKDGILVLTIRPRYFWNNINLREDKRAEIFTLHDNYGYAFKPHSNILFKNEKVYGDSSISRKYIQENWKEWKLIDSDYSIYYPYQLIFVFKKN